VKKTRS